MRIQEHWHDHILTRSDVIDRIYRDAMDTEPDDRCFLSQTGPGSHQARPDDFSPPSDSGSAPHTNAEPPLCLFGPGGDFYREWDPRPATISIRQRLNSMIGRALHRPGGAGARRRQDAPTPSSPEATPLSLRGVGKLHSTPTREDHQ